MKTTGLDRNGVRSHAHAPTHAWFESDMQRSCTPKVALFLFGVRSFAPL